MAAAVRVPNSCLYDSKKGLFNPAWMSGEEWSGGHSQHAQRPTRSAAHTHYHKNTHAHRVTHTHSVHEKRSQKGSSAGVMVGGERRAFSLFLRPCVCFCRSFLLTYFTCTCLRMPSPPTRSTSESRAATSYSTEA